jgi:positive regulator of sigma E activity
VDDVVEISLAPDNLLQAAFLVYGLPLFGAIIAAAIAYAFSLGDAGAALAALLGLSGGLVVGRWRLRQPSCLRRFVPSVERRL